MNLSLIIKRSLNMATLSPRKLKNGLVNYAIQAKVIDPKTGKSKFYCSTWKNTQNLVGKLAKDSAIAYSVEWEKKLRLGIINETITDKDERKLLDKDITFKDIANEWIEIRGKSFSNSYKAMCEFCLPKIIDYFGEKKFIDITARQVQKFFADFNRATFKLVTAVVKENKKEKLNELAVLNGVRKICGEGNFSRPTLYNAYNGKAIEWKSAVAICKRLGIDINEYFDKIEIDKAYERNSVLKYKTIICSIYKYAIKAEIVSKNYGSMEYLDDFITKKKPKEPTILSNEELNKLLKCLEKHPINQTIPIYLLIFLGVRVEEVCGLEFQDIDFENKKIHIKRTRVYVPHKGIIRQEYQTKTINGKRTLSMCELLYEKLIEYKSYYENIKKGNNEFDTCGAVYCTINGNPAFPHLINTLLRKFLIDAGCKVVSPHKMRHLWITMLIDNGVKPSVVARIAGHANPKITLEVYTQYRPEEDDSEEILNSVFSKSKIDC